ncbi:MAG: AAA family ATPase [Clostridia bacterium]|jgi:hypothetical protein
MALRAKNPEKVTPSKPKFLISGASGIGKTFFALDFPKPYLIDCEGGASRQQYQDKLKAKGGVYLGKDEGSQDFKVVIEEIKQLIETKHDYKTLIIDSFTFLYLLEAAKAEAEIGSDFGKDKKEANKPTRQLIRWIEKLDMTVILICHAKEKWVRRGKEIVSEGTTFDGYDKLEYILDLWIEILTRGDSAKFKVKKSRIESLVQNEIYDLKYEKFAELYGKDVLEKDVIPVAMATIEQVERINKLIEIVKIDAETVEKWFSKADVENWAEMTGEQIQKCIDFLGKKVEGIVEQNFNASKENLKKEVEKNKVEEKKKEKK